MGNRSAQGSGTIRKKTVSRNGKIYTYWEARITTGRNPGTGKQIQRSFTGKTQQEVRKKMLSAAVEIDNGTYIQPIKMTVGSWLDVWTSEYLGNLKESTATSYKSIVKNHIKPSIGAIVLSDLRPHDVQKCINRMDSLSPSSISLVYKVLKASLSRAVKLGYIMKNPADGCILPKAEKPVIQPLNDDQVNDIIKSAKGSIIEHLITVALFTGMRQSELLGLTWDSVDFKNGSISVDKQLKQSTNRENGIFGTPKSGKKRVITPASSVMLSLKEQRKKQIEMRLKIGFLWSNQYNLVFTMEDGSIIEHWTLKRYFNAICERAGIEGNRFHDLRHTYAVNSIRAGDDIKTIQANLGHASASFTLDRYGHFTEAMKNDSATRMESFMNTVLNL